MKSMIMKRVLGVLAGIGAGAFFICISDIVVLLIRKAEYAMGISGFGIISYLTAFILGFLLVYALMDLKNIPFFTGCTISWLVITVVAIYINSYSMTTIEQMSIDLIKNFLIYLNNTPAVLKIFLEAVGMHQAMMATELIWVVVRMLDDNRK